MTSIATTACPLFAAGFDWLEALLPFLFVAFWLVSQVFAALRRVQGGGRRQEPPVRLERARGGPRPEGVPADVRSELERQIEEFLREARGEQPRRPATPAATVKQRPDEQRGKPRPQPVAPSPQSRTDKPDAATTGRRPAAPPSSAPATASASAARPSGPQASAAATKAESVARHVEDAFSHDLAHSRSGLAAERTMPDGAEPRPVGLAAELTAMLRSPAATRRAILLREVLDRPVERW